MKRNQKMTVSLPAYGEIRIGHKDLMGSTKDIMAMGNTLRTSKGIREFKIEEVLRTRDFWEFVIVRSFKKAQTLSKAHTLGQFPNCGIHSLDLSIIDQYVNDSGQVEYGKLMKLFPNVIRSQRGGHLENRGVWMDLFLLLKLATKLDKELEHEVYRVFIEEKLLTIRDLGGDSYNDLNEVAKHLTGLTPTTHQYGHSQMRIDISLAVRNKLTILSTRGYNKKEHDVKVQEARLEIKKMAIQLIKMNMIKSFEELMTFIKNFHI